MTLKRPKAACRSRIRIASDLLSWWGFIGIPIGQAILLLLHAVERSDLDVDWHFDLDSGPSTTPTFGTAFTQ